jgi:PAS domain S-box-containing protein
MSGENTTFLFQNAPVAMLVLNRDGQIVQVNAEAVRTLAEKRGDLVGSPVLGLITADDRNRAKEHFLEVLAGRPRDWSARVRRGDGTERVLSLRAVPLEDASGGIRGVVLFATDMTATSGGRPETLQLQTLLENLPGQTILTLDGQGRIRYSAGLSRTHYRDDAESVGLDYMELLEPGDENWSRARAMLEATRSGESWAGTHWHRRVDETVTPVRVFASPNRDPRNGRILGTLVVCREVAVEYDLRHRTERAERLASLGNMAAGVAEQLQSSLASLGETLAPVMASANGAAAPARASLSRMQQLVESVGALGEDVTLERVDLAVDRLLDQALDQLLERCDELGVVLDREMEEDLDTVHVDPRHTLVALEAVLKNALDSLATVPAEDRRLRIRTEAVPEGVVVSIQDTGAGIPGEWADRVFEPFYSTREGQAGLGLTRARELLNGFGGRIWVDPPRGGWTSISMELPHRAPEASFPFRPVPLTITKQRSILVVDDEDAIRSGVRRFLEKVGYDVREAWSGRSALAQITTGQPPEMVVTDLKMSDGSGYWFLDQLARDFPHLVERTVILTGDTEHAEVSRLARRTGCPILRKPLELPHLLETLDRITQRA